MNDKHIFPVGIATDKTFCNRVEERKHLKQCIKNNEHVVLISPRRYGKTSLITQVVKDTKVPSVTIDLLICPTAEYVTKKILDGVGALCTQLSKNQSVLKKIMDIMRKFNPKVTLSLLGQQIELSSNQISSDTISQSLLALEYAAKETGKNIVFALDEFQQIALLKEHHTIEASIRHAVERSQHVTYFFSGSNRHLLEQMFNDRSRPLYFLCEVIRLQRIKQQCLKSFIQETAKTHWQTPLTENALSKIIELSQCHTFYVNRLCRLAFKENIPPIADKIVELWENYMEEQLWIEKDLALLSLNQMKFLLAIAQKTVTEKHGQYMRKHTGMSPSSIDNVIKTLTSKDIIFINSQKEYKVLDPAILYYLKA